MESLVFLDTNIFVYAFDQDEPGKQKVADHLLQNLIQERRAVISYQVIQEFAAVAIRRFQVKLEPAELEKYLNEFLWPMCCVFPEPTLYSDALSIVQDAGWKFYDALIMASAIRSGCELLITEDLQHGRKMRGVEIRNPFA